MATNVLSIASAAIGGASSLVIMAGGYYGRLQLITSQLVAVDQLLLQKQAAITALEEKEIEIETAYRRRPKKAESKEADSPDAQRQAIQEQKEKLEDDVLQAQESRKIVIHRGYQMRRMMSLLLVGIVLAVLSGLWSTLAHYWAGFHWFAVISMLIALVITVISISFAIAELTQGVSSEEAEHKRVLEMHPAWTGPLAAFELQLPDHSFGDIQSK